MRHLSVLKELGLFLVISSVIAIPVAFLVDWSLVAGGTLLVIMIVVLYLTLLKNVTKEGKGMELELKNNYTNRGFRNIEFKDRYGASCSIQKSSLATEDAIWFGINDAEPKIMASQTKQGGTGWVDYEIPKEVSLTTRMHLTQDQVKELLPILQVFAETGELPN